MSYKIDYTILPVHMRDPMQRYIEHGIEPGSFLISVLSNDFVGACLRADYMNSAQMPSFGKFLAWEAPEGCYGSREAVVRWVFRGGLQGRGEENA